MAIEPFLPRKVSKSGGLGQIAVVAVHDVQLEVQPAKSYQPDHVVEADCGGSRFPSGDGGLRGAGTRSELGLSESGPAARFAN